MSASPAEAQAFCSSALGEDQEEEPGEKPLRDEANLGLVEAEPVLAQDHAIETGRQNRDGVVDYSRSLPVLLRMHLSHLSPCPFSDCGTMYGDDLGHSP